MPSDDIFRREAIDHHESARVEGELLYMLPTWTRWVYVLLLALLAVTVVFVCVGSVSQYGEGPAVIRAEARVPVTAVTAGIVGYVSAHPGQQVERGDVLVRFRAADEEAQLRSLQQEFDSALVRMLGNPLDQAARQTLGGLRAQRDLVAARLGERVVRAPEAGTVGDVRVRPGQSVALGELITSIAGDRGAFSVVGLLPGQHRPALRVGLRMRLEISGFSYAYQDLVIKQVEQEVVGPYEVRRMLGPEVADAVAVSGPVVVVHASLASDHFVTQGEEYRYFDGMHGTVQVRLRDERILTTLLPGLRLLTERSR